MMRDQRETVGLGRSSVGASPRGVGRYGFALALLLASGPGRVAAQPELVEVLEPEADSALVPQAETAEQPQTVEVPHAEEAQAPVSSARAAAPRDEERPPSFEPRASQRSGKPEREYSGFISRFAVAGGADSVVTAMPPGEEFREIEFSGFGLGVSMDLGAAIVPNLVLHIRGLMSVLSDPSASADGASSVATKNLTVMMGGAGPALTFYMMPSNVYITGAFGIAGMKLTQEVQGAVVYANSDAGLWANLDVGWDGWLDDVWSMGIAGRATYATMAGGDGSHITSTSFGLVLSFATQIGG